MGGRYREDGTGRMVPGGWDWEDVTAGLGGLGERDWGTVPGGTRMKMFCKESGGPG